jgi:hypothetical protein
VSAVLPTGLLGYNMQVVWGTGIEAAISDNWRLRADFQSWIAQDITVVLRDENDEPVPLKVKTRGHTGRLGLICQFGGP